MYKTAIQHIPKLYLVNGSNDMAVHSENINNYYYHVCVQLPILCDSYYWIKKYDMQMVACYVLHALLLQSRSYITVTT